MSKVHQRGFTLIEMSIVLVIIGLIVGGILKGQELINSAREKNIITQLDQARAAVNTFEDKYQALPGDFGDANNRIAPNSENGNDNGEIGAAVANAAADVDTAMNDGENQTFWNHLLLADLIGGGVPDIDGTIAAVSSFGDGPLPEIAIPSAGLTMGLVTHTGQTGTGNEGDDRTTHYMRPIIFTAADTPGPIFTPQEAAQMDIKTDDGIAYQGTTRTALTGTGCGTPAGADYTAQAGQAADACFILVEITR